MSLARDLAALLLAVAAANALAQECGDKDAKCAKEKALAHPIRNVASWKAELSRPVAERLGPASASLVEYVRLDNIANGFPERPRPGNPDAKLMADIHAAIAELPASVRALFDEKFAGLYFIEELGGTGYTDVIYSAPGKAFGGFILLDTQVLAKYTANQWATWKENTPFKPDPAWKLSARIERDGEDNRKNAIQYILLHELGHVLSIGRAFHPDWTLEPKEVLAAGGTGQYAFFSLSWSIDAAAGRYVTRFDAAFPQRKNVAYYFGAKLEGREMLATYDNLLKTNFASLYGATIPGDDFAEAFASYVHVVLMGRPWEIAIARDGKPVKTIRACWDEARCRDKRRLLEAIVGAGR